jgi:hypothetical protein
MPSSSQTIFPKHPGLLTVHLIALDRMGHEAGPLSREAIAVLESLDVVIERRARPPSGWHVAAPTLPLFPTTALQRPTRS